MGIEGAMFDLQFRVAFEKQNHEAARMPLSLYGIVCQSHALSKKSSMPTRNLVLTEYQTAFVERLVTSGRYQNASEVLREGLRLVERRESEDEMRLAALRDAAKVGVADIDAGNFRSFDSEEMLGQHLATLAFGVIGT